VGYLNVARHGGCGLLSFRDRAAGDDDTVTVGCECGSCRLTDAAVAARDDDPHPAIIQCL
jgi:hypothetical protein